MATITGTHALSRALKSKGLLPDNCRLLEVVMHPDSALILRYEVFVTRDDLIKFADAVQESAAEGTLK